MFNLYIRYKDKNKEKKIKNNKNIKNKFTKDKNNQIMASSWKAKYKSILYDINFSYTSLFKQQKHSHAHTFKSQACEDALLQPMNNKR